VFVIVKLDEGEVFAGTVPKSITFDESKSNGTTQFKGTLIIDNGLVLSDCSDQWNCNLCGNDLPFWIPFENGDSFDFQFQQPNQITEVICENGFLPEAFLSNENAAFATFGIYTCCDDQPLIIDEEIIDAIVEQQYIGSFNSYDYAGNLTVNPIQMIRFRLWAIADFLEFQELEQMQGRLLQHIFQQQVLKIVG